MRLVVKPEARDEDEEAQWVLKCSRVGDMIWIAVARLCVFTDENLLNP